MIRQVSRFPFSLMPEYGKEELTAEVLRGMSNHIMVNLVTVQPHTITKMLLSGETVTCNPELSYFKYYAWAKYDWIASEMDRIGVHHYGVKHPRWPMWAWATMFYSHDTNETEENTSDDKNTTVEITTMNSDQQPVNSNDTPMIDDLLLIRVTADRLLFSSLDDWSAWPFVSYDGITQPPEKIADAMNTDVNLQDAWFDLSDSSTSSERLATWWRCDRPLSAVIDACSTRQEDLYNDDGFITKPIIQACLWELKPEDVAKVINGGDPFENNNMNDSSIQETIYNWLHENGRPC